MKGVLGEAGYGVLKVCHQVFFCLEADSTGAITATTSSQKASPLKHLVVVKVLGRIGPGAVEYGQYLKRHIVYTEGQGFQWLEDPNHLAAIITNRSKIGAKPQSSPRQQGSREK